MISAFLSQIISNVPAAVMLSGFTENGTELLLGVNLGGLGTLIASLGSLISYQIYRKAENANSGKYLLLFSAVNFSMLTVMLLFNFLIR
ncbi:MAG: citrate transporter, partial [Oscillospiraceae bacterium]|nr:citrate transporter [Oscillospiraceae bacterium]